MHYENAEEMDFAARVKRSIQEYAPRLHHYFENRPQTDVHIRFNSLDESANGMATGFPYNIMTLNLERPDKTSYLYSEKSKWIDTLVVHEYIHIITMDMTSGVVDWLRYLFGSSVKVNGVMPSWAIEGVAVWAEDEFVGSGRAQDQDLLDDLSVILNSSNSCTDISCLDEPNHRPYGGLPYWVGGSFFKYVEDQKPETLSCIFNNHSDQIPFFFHFTFKNCFGKGLESTFEDYLVSMRGRTPCNKNREFCRWLDKNDFKTELVEWQIPPIKKNGQYYFVYKPIYKNGTSEQFLYSLSSKNLELIQLPFRYGSAEWVSNLIEKDRNLYVESTQSTVMKLKRRRYLLNQGKFQEVKKKSFSQREPVSKKLKSEGYFPLRYLTPEFLLTEIATDTNEYRLNVSTQLVDPLNQHQTFLNFGLLSFDAGRKNNYSLTHRYNQFEINEESRSRRSYSISGGRYSYLQSFDDSYVFSESLSIGHSQSYSYQNHSFSFSVNASQGKEEGGIFDREYTQGSVSGGYTKRWASSQLSFGGALGHNSNQNLEDYFFTNLSARYATFFNRLRFTTSLKFAKFFKDVYSGGLVRGGGYSSALSGTRSYEFYPVAFGNLLGNEMYYGNLNLSYPLRYFGIGYGMFPAFLKSTRLKGGVQAVKTDFYISTTALERNQDLYAAYAGLSLSTKLAYQIDVDIDVIYSQI
jgi:hypothetical protein